MYVVDVHVYTQTHTHIMRIHTCSRTAALLSDRNLDTHKYSHTHTHNTHLLAHSRIAL
jgi:hypothetical protein